MNMSHNTCIFFRTGLVHLVEAYVIVVYVEPEVDSVLLEF